jgi:U32 family peptidase
MKTPKLPELLLPAGDLHRADIAFKYGADAVYVGLNAYSLRKAENRFTTLEIKKAIALAHSQDKKIYVTFNIFAHNVHLEKAREELKKIGAYGPDAFIISDPGLISLAKKAAPKTPIHLSTQANTINIETVKFWQTQGIERIVLGREATLKDIQEIKKAVPRMELEVFVHGAMCISYSGRCLMSAALTGRSANLGACTQPCRWPYNLYLEDQTRPGEYMKMEESDQGTYLMSSKDMNMIEYLDKLVEAGVDSLKIEGRNKTDYYVATVARAYLRGLDAVKNGKYTPKLKKVILAETEALTRRGYTTGFFFGAAKKGETFPGRQPIHGKRYLGYITKYHKDNWSTVLVKNKIESGQTYELVTPDQTLPITSEQMKDKSTKITVANPATKDKKVIVKSSIPMPPDSYLREGPTS